MRNNLILIILIIGLVSFSIFTNSGAEFGGADGNAEEVISEINPDYEPWFKPIWEPPSGEIESMLFAVQASAGTGFICFFIGYAAGKKGEPFRF